MLVLEEPEQVERNGRVARLEDSAGDVSDVHLDARANLCKKQ